MVLCGWRDGQRYDLVAARLHASVMPNHRNTGSYPANGTPFANKKSCIQHVRLAKTERDWKLSDHFGTIIEVGPEAQYCSPMKAKAAAQKRRLAGAPPPPNNDETRDKYLGIHTGNFAHVAQTNGCSSVKPAHTISFMKVVKDYQCLLKCFHSAARWNSIRPLSGRGSISRFSWDNYDAAIKHAPAAENRAIKGDSRSTEGLELIAAIERERTI